jgi:WXXGXW repeat (2 copies)
MTNALIPHGLGRSSLAWGWAAKFILVAALFSAGTITSHAQVSIGIQIGAPPPPRVIAVVPPTPGPEYVWIEGYWYPVGRHYRWHAGYWTLPPYAGAVWVPPHHDGDRYFVGYWNGDRGRFEHDHHWDRDHDRDHDRWRDHDAREHHGDDRDHRDHDDHGRH